MNAPFTLPLAEPPRPEESFFSYLLRMTQLHGFRRPSALFTRFGMTPRTYELVFRQAPTPDLQDAWAALFGMSVEQLRVLAPWRVSESTSNIMGHAIADGCLVFGTRRVCTACVAEAGMLHASCHIGLLSHCPIHGLPFQEKCGTCGSSLRWVGGHLGHCSNRSCFHELEAPSDHDRLSPEFTFPATIMSWLRRDPGEPVDAHGATPGEAIVLAFELGRMIKGWSRAGMKGSGRVETFLRRHAAEMPAIMQAGCDALSDWPNGMLRALDKLRSYRHESRRSFGMERSYGRLVPWLLTRGSKPWAGPLRQVMALHAARSGDRQEIVDTIVRYGGLDPAEVDFEPMTLAAKRLGLTFTTMAQLLTRRPELIYRAASGRTRVTLLRRSAVDELLHELEDGITRAEAVRLLGVSRECLNELLGAGLIVEVDSSRRVSERRSLSRRSIAAFISSQRGAAAEVSSGEEGRYLSLYRLSLRWDGVATICAAIRDGYLSPARVDSSQPGIAAMLFCEAEAKRCLDAYLGRTGGAAAQ